MNYSTDMKAHGINILVEPVHREKTKGGIILPELSQDPTDFLQEAKVVAVGDGDYVGGSVKMKVKQGDTVWYRGVKGGKAIKLSGSDNQNEKRKVITISDIILYETN